jgi:hypothetical protein
MNFVCPLGVVEIFPFGILQLVFARTTFEQVFYRGGAFAGLAEPECGERLIVLEQGVDQQMTF